MLLLDVNYIVIYDFGSSATDVIHPSVKTILKLVHLQFYMPSMLDLR